MNKKNKKNRQSGEWKSNNLAVQPIVTNRGISSIDALWGVKTQGYKFDNLEDYEDKLKKMSSFDLEKHAFEYDISPEVPRDIIIDQLVRLFKMHLMKSKGKLQEIPQITPEMNKKLIAIANS